MQQAAETYTGYQGLLGLPAEEFANLTAAEKEAEGRLCRVEDPAGVAGEGH